MLRRPPAERNYIRANRSNVGSVLGTIPSDKQRQGAASSNLTEARTRPSARQALTLAARATTPAGGQRGAAHYISAMSDAIDANTKDPDAHHQAAQRVADALLSTLTQECGRARAEAGLELDDLIGITLTALVSLTAQFASHFDVDPDQLAVSFVKALEDANEESPNLAGWLH
jgi:hypothetical protein